MILEIKCYKCESCGIHFDPTKKGFILVKSSTIEKYGVHNKDYKDKKIIMLHSITELDHTFCNLECYRDYLQGIFEIK